ncbi:riboflavin biosynthesis pyrimidine reductase [Mycobacterium frederiksbergense]|uniref:Riboflavin biosynthesis pyrimidine reductase n=1 Tax=Mycolicibacterium frederiksbergense TaxID=117567 RepID=A0ABT6KS54_9MYCO|nr:pyrimidine reductase family protein [Mycolicibacterium frederiksbergense]MDH6193567.1 riboflavin biosynthesis pyrimidine reductase [Mycolicibacterium frederiksbergense]
MSDDTAGTDLTVLGNVDKIADGQLADYYAYPDDLQRCWVRGNMISSLDGGATEGGKSGGLGGRGDRAVFNLMRQTADVVLMGASTVRIENYSGVQLSVAQRQERQRRGQAEVPPIAVVTASANLDYDSKFFTRTEVPPLILTATDTVADARRRLGAVAEVIDASGADPSLVDPAVALRILAERKLFRVLTEGGPSLLSLLIEDDLLDELCLTVAPILVGGAARRIVSGSGQAHTRMRPAHLLTDDEGYLYTRYVRE